MPEIPFLGTFANFPVGDVPGPFYRGAPLGAKPPSLKSQFLHLNLKPGECNLSAVVTTT